MAKSITLGRVKWHNREVTVIHGITFYKSTGKNSGDFGADTWLPMLGCTESSERGRKSPYTTEALYGFSPAFMKPAPGNLAKKADALASLHLGFTSLNKEELEEELRNKSDKYKNGIFITNVEATDIEAIDLSQNEDPIKASFKICKLEDGKVVAEYEHKITNSFNSNMVGDLHDLKKYLESASTGLPLLGAYDYQSYYFR